MWGRAWLLVAIATCVMGCETGTTTPSDVDAARGDAGDDASTRLDGGGADAGRDGGPVGADTGTDAEAPADAGSDASMPEDAASIDAGRCGDLAIQPGETCDDGNTDPGDYCAADCSAITGTCGDGTTQTNEVCDDGNTAPGDYCASDCSAVTGTCGDSTRQTNEACDDGNTAPGDYCASDCSAVTGACGDSTRQTNEACDDGNTAPGDYCASDCSAITGRCGDDVTQSNEACDDGSTNGTGEGFCLTTCQGTQHCGDDVPNGTEVCDNGTRNGMAGRCDSACMFVCTGACPARVRVGASGGDGRSWTTAYGSIAAAVSGSPGAPIWLSGDHAIGASWDLPATPITGGFAGSEALPSQRPTGSLSRLSIPSSIGTTRNADLTGFDIRPGADVVLSIPASTRFVFRDGNIAALQIALANTAEVELDRVQATSASGPLVYGPGSSSSFVARDLTVGGTGGTFQGAARLDWARVRVADSVTFAPTVVANVGASVRIEDSIFDSPTGLFFNGAQATLVNVSIPRIGIDVRSSGVLSMIGCSVQATIQVIGATLSLDSSVVFNPTGPALTTSGASVTVTRSCLNATVPGGTTLTSTPFVVIPSLPRDLALADATACRDLASAASLTAAMVPWTTLSTQASGCLDDAVPDAGRHRTTTSTVVCP
ncbi:MAG: DUF4215 domain-containing protein [Sandaracinus sp.]